MFITSLNGCWQYCPDFNRTTENLGQIDALKRLQSWNEINIPGCWETLEEDKMSDGPVWFMKNFSFEQHDCNKNGRVHLCFDGVSYFCEIYLNDIFIGIHEGQWDKFDLDVTGKLADGKINKLLLKVYKQGYADDSRYHFRETLSGFIPDVSCTFGGVWRDVYLVETGCVFIKDVFVKPDASNRNIYFTADIDFPDGLTGVIDAEVKIKTAEGCNVKCSKYTVHGVAINGTVTLDDIILWEPENPFMYIFEISIFVEGILSAVRTKRFGIRDLQIQGSNIQLNGKSVYLRGILHWGYSTEIAPNPPRETIIKEIDNIKKMGFNLIKFCLYVPSQEYLDIADEKGILTWLEFPLWLPRATERLFDRVREQYMKILAQVRNHPSLILYSLGCELNSDVGAELLKELYSWVRDNTNSCLIRDNSGSGECYDGHAVDFADFYDYHFYSDLNYIEPLMDVYTAGWREKRPWLFGEFCDADTIKQPELMDDLKDRKAWWMINEERKNPLLHIHKTYPLVTEQMVSFYRDNGNKARKLAALSLKQAMIHRKYTVEAVRSYPEITGYVITAIVDTPITSSGIFDEKGRCKYDSGEFLQFNSPCVLTLCRDIETKWRNGGNRVHYSDCFNYIAGSLIRVYPVLSNFSGMDFAKGRFSWTVVSENGEKLSCGCENVNVSVQTGSVAKLCNLEFVASDFNEVQKVMLKCIYEYNGETFHNEWPFWIYPQYGVYPLKKAGLYDPGCLLEGFDSVIGDVERVTGTEFGMYETIIAARYNAKLMDYAFNGGKVLLIQRGCEGFPVKMAPFWRECVKEFRNHHITDSLHHGEVTDLQFMGMATDTSFIPEEIEKITGNSVEYNPLLRRIDCRNFSITDYIVELKIGSGAVIATTLRLEGGSGKQPSLFGENTAAIYFVKKCIDYFNSK